MANPTIEWTKVLTNPLGLAGYVLSLIFGLLARATRRNERRWLVPVAVTAACIALLGGLGLAYRDVAQQYTPAAQEGPIPAKPAPSPAPPQHAPGKVEVKGNHNQVFSNLESQGDMTINAGTNSGNAQPAKPIKNK